MSKSSFSGVPVAVAVLAAVFSCVSATDVAAQQPAAASGGGVRFTVEMETRIRDFYSANPASNAEALPPGIRRRLERGKPLPPGIAKKVAPDALIGRVDLPAGYQLVEVGLDVLLVEVATQVVRGVLMDVIR